MSTNALTPPATTSSQANPRTNDVGLTFPRVVRSEWIKFRTLRSTIWTLAITLVLMVGIVTLFSAIGASQSHPRRAETGGSSIVPRDGIATALAQLAVSSWVCW